MGILWFIFYTGRFAKLGRCGWYILLVVNNKVIEENSKFHERLSLIVSDILKSLWCIGNIYYLYPSGDCLYCTCESQFLHYGIKIVNKQDFEHEKAELQITFGNKITKAISKLNEVITVKLENNKDEIILSLKNEVSSVRNRSGKCESQFR